MNSAATPQELEKLGRLLASLKDDGRLDQANYDRLHQRFVFRDSEGGIWTVGTRTGKWHRKQQNAWASFTPPASLLVDPDLLETLRSLANEAPTVPVDTPVAPPEKKSSAESSRAGDPGRGATSRSDSVAMVEILSAIEVIRSGGQNAQVLEGSVQQGVIRVREKMELVVGRSVVANVSIEELIAGGVRSETAAAGASVSMILENVTREMIEDGLRAQNPEKILLRTPSSASATSPIPVPIVIPESIGESAVVTRWFFSNGESVQQGQIVVAVESDKISLELESPASGVLNILRPFDSTVSPGNTVGEVQ